jgi:hypothetical protein
MIFVDFSPLTISNNFSNMSGKGEKKSYPNPEELRIILWSALGDLNAQHRHRYGKMCVAMDNKPYWRSEIFPHYKKNRKKLGDEIHWGIINEMELRLKDHTPWKIISIPTLEADDIIGTLAPIMAQKEECLIVSPDGDFRQLQIHENIHQIDIIRGRDMSCENPELFLREAFICGQTKDGIPNMLSDADTFVDPTKRQKPMTAKRKREFLKTDPAFWDDKTHLARYRENEKLIDLAKIPDDIKRKVKYEFALWPTTGKKPLRKYFVENRMAQCADNVRNFS